ncbi:MAG: ABC transporter ATP-binding protein [Lachnospiraceae bacterium]|nr:ABC transporter ATP-binding protein [Lachnospiraceae bacterium]
MERDKKYNILQNLAYCASVTLKKYPPLLIWCICIILINAGLPVITAYLPKVVIEEITAKSALTHILLVTGIFTFSMAVLMGLQKYLEKLIYWNKFKMNDFFLRMVTRKGLTTDYRNQENEHFRKLQSESFASCNGNFSYYARTYDAAVQFFSNLLGLLAFGGILIALNPLLIVFLCVTTVISFFLNRRIIKWVDRNKEERIGYEQRMQYIIHASNDMRSAKDIRLYHMAGWMDRLYRQNLSGILSWYRKYTAKLFGVAAVDSGLTFFREGVTYLFLIYLVWKGRLSVAEFVLYFNVVAGFSVWLGSILGQFNTLSELSMSMNRFRSYLEYPETYKRANGIPVKESGKPGVIKLEHVSFRYTGDGEDILKDINLELSAGEHLAVVGLNGAGKTTLAKLILGLTDPTEGRVLYDGVDVRELNRDDYYRQFGAVFQDYSVLPVTIEEIVAEDTEEHVDRERVEECLKKAGLWEKIASLEQGTKSLYDRAFWDNGINLSGGEMQKLLLARALYKQAPVVLLDEPTAALDPLAENRLYETYDEIMKGKTTVFISHRLASTRFCDRILLISGGQVSEEGTHEELLALGGTYHSLFETQAKYYREHPEETLTENEGSESEEKLKTEDFPETEEAANEIAKTMKGGDEDEVSEAD